MTQTTKVAPRTVQAFRRVLEYTGGKQARVALLLGIARRTLRTKPRELGLHVAHPVRANEGGGLRSRTGCRPRDASQSRLEAARARDLLRPPR